MASFDTICPKRMHGTTNDGLYPKPYIEEQTSLFCANVGVTVWNPNCVTFSLYVIYVSFYHNVSYN